MKKLFLAFVLSAATFSAAFAETPVWVSPSPGAVAASTDGNDGSKYGGPEPCGCDGPPEGVYGGPEPAPTYSPGGGAPEAGPGGEIGL